MGGSRGLGRKQVLVGGEDKERKREKGERSDGPVVDTYVCINSLVSHSLWSGLPIS